MVPEDTRARERQAPTTPLLRQVQVKISDVGLSAEKSPEWNPHVSPVSKVQPDLSLSGSSITDWLWNLGQGASPL